MVDLPGHEAGKRLGHRGNLDKVGSRLVCRFEDEPERPLPRYLADGFAWEPMTQKAAEVFHGLALQVQANTAIFANDYGEGAAIDFFGPPYGLPASIRRQR